MVRQPSLHLLLLLSWLLQIGQTKDHKASENHLSCDTTSPPQKWEGCRRSFFQFLKQMKISHLFVSKPNFQYCIDEQLVHFFQAVLFCCSYSLQIVATIMFWYISVRTVVLFFVALWMCLSSEVFLRHPKNFENVKDKSLSVTIASVVLRALPGVLQ